MTSHPSAPMVSALVKLHASLKRSRLGLDVPEVSGLREVHAELVAQLEDYVLPRLIQIDAPLLTVVGGSTGAGKSTLVNSIVGETVTEAGVLRPTTRSPVLVHHPADSEWFDKARILPDFKRTSRISADPGALQLVASPRVPEGLAVLDAPDVDSVEQQNRELAGQLMAAADMWLFVTSAARYADQVPWEFLRRAADRSTAVAVVLDRTAPAALDEVARHLTRMLRARGLRDSPLFTVPEAALDESGLLPPECVEQIQDWLERLAADTDARSAIVRQTLGGAIRTITRRTYDIADALAAQQRAVGSMRAEVEEVYDRSIRAAVHACSDGTIVRGEVQSRWQEFVGTGELLETMESKVSWARDRVGRALRRESSRAGEVALAIEAAMQALLGEHAEAAADGAETAWRATSKGRVLLETARVDLSRASAGFIDAARQAVRDWQRGVLDLVRTEGADKRTNPRVLAYGVNGLAVALMITASASPDGTGPAEGGAAVGQKLLEAVFGEQAVQRMVSTAHKDLIRRVGVLLDPERRRYVDLLDDATGSGPTAEDVRTLARKVDDLRYSREGEL